MITVALFVLFFVLFASRALGFDTSLAPGLSVKNAFLYLIFIALAIETAVTRRRSLELLPVFVPMTLYVAYATFSWIVVLLILDYPGYSSWTSLMGLKGGPIEDLMVLLIFFYGITDARRGLLLLQGMTWLVIVGNVFTVFDGLGYFDIGLPKEEDGRVGGTIGPVNQFGAFLAFMMPFVIANYLTSKGAWKLLAGIGLLFSGLAFIMALSRGAIVGLILGGLLGAFYLRAAIPAQTLVRTGMALVIAGGAVIFGAFLSGYGDLLVDRFAGLGGTHYEAGSGRTMIWGTALREMLNHPVTFVTGFGWYAYDTASPTGFATHNVYLHIFYNLGMIGVSLFLVTAGNALGAARRALNQASPESSPWLMAFVFGFLSLLVTIFFGNFAVAWLYVWAFVGISLRIAIAQVAVETSVTRDGGVTATAVPGSAAVGAGGTRVTARTINP